MLQLLLQLLKYFPAAVLGGAVWGVDASDENRSAVLGDVFSLLFDLMTTEGVTKDFKVCYCGLSLAPL